MTRPLAGLALAAALAASAPRLRAQDSALVVLETNGNGLTLAKAISLPFEIALFPVHLFGHGVNQGLKWVDDRRVIAKVAVLMARIEPFSVRVKGFGEHSGLGPGLAVAFGDDRDRGWSAGAAETAYRANLEYGSAGIGVSASARAGEALRFAAALPRGDFTPDRDQDRIARITVRTEQGGRAAPAATVYLLYEPAVRCYRAAGLAH